MTENPFRALGLDDDPGLTDDDVRAAWHRTAAATHPDRADGGDPAAFSAAAAAYSDLRTPFGRGEARADLARRSSSARRRWHRPARWRPAGPPGHAAAQVTWGWAARLAGGRRTGGRRAGGRLAGGRLAGGRPVRLAVLVAAGAGAGVLAVLIDGWQPASVALSVGAATWVLTGARRYLGAGAAAGPAAASRLPAAAPPAADRAADAPGPAGPGMAP